MEKKLIGMIGYFATGLSKAGGQEAKTCSIAAELDAIYGSKNVIKVDTLNWKRKPLMPPSFRRASERALSADAYNKDCWHAVSSRSEQSQPPSIPCH